MVSSTENWLIKIFCSNNSKRKSNAWILSTSSKNPQRDSIYSIPLHNHSGLTKSSVLTTSDRIQLMKAITDLSVSSRVNKCSYTFPRVSHLIAIDYRYNRSQRDRPVSNRVKVAHRRRIRLYDPPLPCILDAFPVRDQARIQTTPRRCL